MPSTATGSIEAAGIARAAASAAAGHPEGRPLFAGHASLPWPDDPHLVLWHAQTLLREFRGDNHIAALTIEGLTGCEALVTHTFGEGVGVAGASVGADVLKSTRQRTDDDWAAAVASLRARGWIDDAELRPNSAWSVAGGSRTERTHSRSARTPRSAKSGAPASASSVARGARR